MKISIVILFFFSSFQSGAQDLAFARKMVDTLASRSFWGRGYTEDGMKKTADFLSAQFKAYGLKPMDGKNFQQAFSYPGEYFSR